MTSVRVESVTLKAFRSFKDATMSFSDLNLIIGQNGSGKSTFLYALDLVLNNSHSIKDTDKLKIKHTPKSRPRIIIRIVGLTAKKKDTAVKIQKKPDGTLTIECRLNNKANWILFGEDDSTISISTQEVLSAIDQIKEHLIYAYIDTRRDNSILSDKRYSLLTRTLEQIFEAKQRDRFGAAFRKTAGDVQRYLGELSNHLNQAAACFEQQELNVVLSDSFTSTILAPYLDIQLKDKQGSYPLSNLGSGTQSTVITALLVHLAKESGKSLCLAIDEPEQNLHPQAQRDFFAFLRSQTNQLLATTHSPTLTQQVAIDNIILCHHNNGISNTKQTITPVSNGAPLGINRFFNHEILFSRHVILTEGPTDNNLVTEILAEMDPSFLNRGLLVVDVGSESNLESVATICKTMGIPFSIICDFDHFIAVNYPTKTYTISNDTIKTRNTPQISPKPKLKKRSVARLLNTPSRPLIDILLDIHHGTKLQSNYTAIQALNLFIFRQTMELDLLLSPSGSSVIQSFRKSIKDQCVQFSPTLSNDGASTDDLLRQFLHNGSHGLKQVGVAHKLYTSITQSDGRKHTSLYFLKGFLRSILNGL